MKTASWFTPLPADHVRIGISRGTPRGFPAGYRLYKRLAPGPWFNSVGVLEYDRRYREEILGHLSVTDTIAAILELAAGRTPVLCCFEKPNTRTWCHRAMAAIWLGASLGRVVPEIGFEDLPQHAHPLLPSAILLPRGSNHVLVTENGE